MLLYTRDGRDPGSLWCMELHRSPGQASGVVAAAGIPKTGRTGGMAGVATCRNSIWHVVAWPVRDCRRFLCTATVTKA
jgi:hypothetical protein